MSLFVFCFAVVFLQICGGEEISVVDPKQPASECGVPAGGYIIQKITKQVSSPVNPHWSKNLQKLYFVEEYKNTVCIYDMDNGELSEIVIDELQGKHLKFFIPIKGQLNTYWLITTKEIKVLELLYKDGFVSEYNLKDHKPTSQENDLNAAKGRTDDKGRLFYGTYKSKQSERNTTELIMVNKEDDPVAVYKIGVSSQLAFRKDYKKIYVLRHKKQVIYELDYNSETGNVAEQGEEKVAFNVSEHQHYVQGDIIDFVLDSDNIMWIAFSNSIIEYNCEENKIENKLSMPENGITGIVWAGKKLNHLIVVTSNLMMDPILALTAGSTYAVSGFSTTGVESNDIVL